MNKKITIDFIGVGAQKAGTTWLAKCLMEHPDIYIPSGKEIDFFNKTQCLSNSKNTYNYKKGIKWYENKFNKYKNEKIKGEFSTHYLYDQYSPKLIHKHFPNVKIIIALRNPINRAISQYFHVKKRININSNFEEALEKYPELLERGLYSKQIKNYYRYFNNKNIKIIFFNDIKNKPKIVLEELYKFLDVDPNFTPSILYKKTNSRKKVKNTFIRNIKNKIKNSPLNLLLTMCTKLKLKKKLEKLYLTEDNKKHIISIKTKKKMLIFFNEDTKELERITNRDLSSWK